MIINSTQTKILSGLSCHFSSPKKTVPQIITGDFPHVWRVFLRLLPLHMKLLIMGRNIFTSRTPEKPAKQGNDP